ncbi:MAG: hypothetical protein SOV57_02025 [Bacilli bacterium]|nr:hypothetical protein [Erysipelotrichaceae bacterium]MDD7382385.1 hypothetical protein [Bacillales bacterium]MDY2745971.1 hypothetical protein [Bacilli bacterium]MDY3890658.1 hypothetical protein [Bacilli bacterium]MDY6142264.1 hypothetical protein [Bacilli bacterium]
MSSISNMKHTVVLFIPGLGCDGYFYNRTIQKLESNTRNVQEYSYNSNGITENELNMNNFDVEGNCFREIIQGDYSKSSKLYKEFDNKISAIVSLAISNPNKAILVKLTLQYYPCFENGTIVTKKYDSINNQKEKLCFIIDKIKNKNRGIRIILVGHSQGGLVNLEAAISRSNSIYKVISLSTPYRSVLAADLLAIPLLIGKIIESSFGTNIFSNLSDFDLDDVNYQNRVLNLSSDAYFTDLHIRWNNLVNRPPLLVISGTSGHLVTRDIGVIRTKQSFDGLVRTCEQNNIANATHLNLAKTTVPCLPQKTIFNETCFDHVLSPCYYLCPLPNFGIKDALFRTGLNVLFKAIKNKNFNFLNEINSVDDIGVVKAINAGLNRGNDYESAYQNYYDIYASDYSHMYLPQCDEVIGRLIFEFNN